MEIRIPRLLPFTASTTAVDRETRLWIFWFEAEDADGDTLYYGWSFSGNTAWGVHSMEEESLNSNKASKSLG